MGLEQMRIAAACPSQGETVAPDWELGKERAQFSELEYPEHGVGGGVIVQMLQTLALKEIFLIFWNEHFSICSLSLGQFSLNCCFKEIIAVSS